VVREGPGQKTTVGERLTIPLGSLKKESSVARYEEKDLFAQLIRGRWGKKRDTTKSRWEREMRGGEPLG